MRLSDNDLLDLVQRRTLRYFRDFAHPVSAMARERSAGTTDYDVMETVTTGGTGFGIMALIAGAERGFVPRAEARDRIATIVDFLTAAPRYNGAFAHWMNGTTGATVAFSDNDTGGDIIETAFLMAGLLTARQWLGPGALATRIDALWHGVNWAGFCPAPDRMMWHWRPEGAAVGLPIRGYHEGLIAFVLALASPSHPIDVAAYDVGWKSSTTFENGRSYYGHRLPLGPDFGGPLFFTHYSFMGLDPRGLVDRHADYFAQNRAHALIHHAYAQDNPKGFAGYGPAWGLTACDGDRGYNAFSPTNDHGVIAPTAAISSLPYAPDESLAALRHYHEAMGDRLWGDYGFRDAFNETAGWVAESHLAIDQGPIVVMVENARSGLLWRLFMSAPEIAPALAKMGFSRPAPLA
ncbi:MAG: hypothetical protein KGI94_00355 [Paracoccaceae bacterium]|nr:hypothetical protein [Paracoccaceae bacterium]